MQPKQQEDLCRHITQVTIGYDGDDYVVGRPDLGVYVAVPEPGAVFITALQAGESVVEATSRASEAAGEPVDGTDFLAGLAEVGLLAAPSGVESTSGGGKGRRIRWIEGVNPRAARRLFGPAAWVCYAAAAVFAAGVLLLRPDLRPSWEDIWFLSDPVLSVLAYMPVALLLVATHEAWHWLAGRAAGVPSVFRVSNRGFFLVFETDLTQIVTLPGGRRFGRFVAGMAIDSAVLATALALRLLYREELLLLPAVVDRFLGVLVLYQTIVIVWQWAAVFLRNDGYAVLANALRCHNLYRVSWLTAKRRLFRPTDDERAELDAASERDRSVAVWFALVHVAGFLAMVWVFFSYALPFLVALLGWVLGNLRAGSIGTRTFWESAALLVCLAAQYGIPPLLALREQRMRKAGELL
jgi:hypothetical protein